MIYDFWKKNTSPEGLVKQQWYAAVIQSKILSQTREWFPNGNQVFMYNGARGHRIFSLSAASDIEMLL